MSPNEAAEIYLADDVYFCCRGKDIVFLDLTRDEYTLVNGRPAERIRHLMGPATSEEPGGQRNELLTEVLEAGLLTTDRRVGKALVPTRVEVALNSLVDDGDLAQASIAFGHLVTFATACIRAHRQLARTPLKSIIAQVVERKSRMGPMERDMSRLRAMTAVFGRLRPYFPRDYLCLYDSLALLEFLAHYRLFPTWVFGISLEPWAAHCWLQEREYVVNEGVEEAANFTAVMAI